MSSDPIGQLIAQLGRLPGIGERTATRLAFHIIRWSRDNSKSLARDLAGALLEVADRVGLCVDCQNLCAGERCSLCSDARRDRHLVCVVESVQDLRAIEQTAQFRGLYHVLHGALAPLDGVGPEDLKLDELLSRVRSGEVTEVILATNTNVEGDATALYIARLLAPLGVSTTRLASGIPLGGELEYIDQATLGRALVDRRAFDGA